MTSASANGTKRYKLVNKLPGNDLPMVIITLALVVFGLIMLASASQAYALQYYGDTLYFIKDQLLYACIGVLFMFIISRINYRFLIKLAWPIYILAVVLLVITLFMPAVNSAHRWIFIAGRQFQPSEIAKFAVILLFAFLMSQYTHLMRKVTFGYLFFLALIGIIAVIMLKQPHISGTVLIVLIGVVMMFIGGTRPLWFLVTAAVAIPGGYAYLRFSDKFAYALQRIEAWFDPFKFASNTGYQTIQSLLAIGSGGAFGLGLGNSRQKHLYVPEPQNDFIFSIVCEELGFIGALFVIIMFAYFIIRGFSIAFKAKDKFGAMLATGITAQIGLQTLLNIAVVTNVVPNTGISLPFFSQGGTSMVILLMEVGVLLSISRYSKIEKF